MKSIFLLLLVIFGVCFLITPTESSEIRIRVISNSDSKEDIEYKKEVVEYLKEEVFPYIELEDRYLKENYKNIEEDLSKEFSNIKVEYKKHRFKNKTYNNSAIKDGTFNTLLISIKDAKGSNWWGSVFDSKLVYESEDEIEYKWYFKEGE